MKKIFLIILSLMYINITYAQITFQKTFDDFLDDETGRFVQQTLDGGYTVIGTDWNNNKIHIIKTDSNGNVLWTKLLNIQIMIYTSAAFQSADGGYIISGTTGVGAGQQDIFLLKADSTGNTLWIKTFGGTLNEYGMDAKQTNDGGFILVGSTRSYGAGEMDVYVIKTDSAGNMSWSKTFGGINNELGKSVQQTSDGGFMITGNTESFGTCCYDFYLIKTDSIGNALWTRTYGEIVPDEDLNCALQTNDGGYILAGTYSTNEICLAKTDSLGNLLWSKIYGGSGIEYGYSVQQCNDAGYIICGFTNSFGASGFDKVYLVKTDSIGNEIWSKTYGGPEHDRGSFARQTNDGGYIVTGSYHDLTTFENIYIIKTDSLGNSGCNENNVSTIVTNTAFQVANPPTQDSSGGIVTSPVINTIIGVGVAENILCTTVGINNLTQQNNSLIIFPNPVSNIITISFSLLESQEISLKIFDVNGRLVTTLADKIYEAGEHQLEFNAEKLNAGIYFLKMKTHEFTKTEKLIVIK